MDFAQETGMTLQDAGQEPMATRRSVLKGLGGGLLLAVSAGGKVWAQQAAQPPKYGGDRMAGGLVDNPLVFVSIAADGLVTVVCHRSEMGQGVRTSLPMIVADELEADLARVRVAQATGDESRYGSQNTDGSRSIRHGLAPMRRVGAAARTMLETAAAQRWGVPVSQVVARNHELVHLPTGRKLGFGEVAQAAAALPVPPRASLRLKDPRNFRYIGAADIRLTDGEDIMRGKAVFGADVRLPGMLHAAIARPPVMGSKVKKYDASKALQVSGVIKVVEIESTPLPAGHHPLGGIAVVARNTWAAFKGRDALVIEWEQSPHAVYDSAQYRKSLESAVRQPGNVRRNEGDALKVLAQASGRKVEAEYYLPHISHAPMEPMVATARIANGVCEVWAPSQYPEVPRNLIAQRLGLKKEQVVINITLLGGGFGRKAAGDFVIEAAVLSHKLGGEPVQVQWSRTDDLRNGYYHTVAAERLESVLDEKGMPQAWLHRSAAPPIRSLHDLKAKTLSVGEVGMTAINVPFKIPNLRLETPNVDAHTRIGWFRSVLNIPHAFAIQSFVHELAVAAGRDPKDYLLDLIGEPRRIDPRSQNDNNNYGEDPQLYPIDTGRMRRVIELAAAGAQWGRKRPKGRGLGIAMAYSFMSYAAVAVEVEVSPEGDLRVLGVDTALDCGPHINVERLRSQLEGAVIMGMGLALHGEISFREGQVVQSNFHDYRVLRADEAPQVIRVHLAPSDFSVPPGGGGEPGLPPVAPALCNAIFAATGKRIRSLPIANQLKA